MYEFFHRAKFCSLETKNGQLDRFMAKKKLWRKFVLFFKDNLKSYLATEYTP